LTPIDPLITKPGFKVGDERGNLRRAFSWRGGDSTTIKRDIISLTFMGL